MAVDEDVVEDVVEDETAEADAGGEAAEESVADADKPVEEESDPAATEGSEIEEIDGIGPTYAERLRAAGVGTIAQLVDPDAAEIAEAAGVSESRAADWQDQARD
jgi:polyhydroxyalkanoate synthase